MAKLIMGLSQLRIGGVAVVMSWLTGKLIERTLTAGLLTEWSFFLLLLFMIFQLSLVFSIMVPVMRGPCERAKRGQLA